MRRLWMLWSVLRYGKLVVTVDRDRYMAHWRPDGMSMFIRPRGDAYSIVDIHVRKAVPYDESRTLQEGAV